MPFAVGFTADEIHQALSSCLKYFNFNVVVNIASRPAQHFSILPSVSVTFFFTFLDSDMILIFMVWRAFTLLYSGGDHLQLKVN